MHKWKLEFTVFSLGKWDLGRQDWGLQKKTEDGLRFVVANGVYSSPNLSEPSGFDFK